MCIRDRLNAEFGLHIETAVINSYQPASKEPLVHGQQTEACLLYTSDAADERSSVDLGGRRIIKKKKQDEREEKSKYKQKQYHTHRQRELHTK